MCSGFALASTAWGDVLDEARTGTTLRLFQLGVLTKTFSTGFTSLGIGPSAGTDVFVGEQPSCENGGDCRTAVRPFRRVSSRQPRAISLNRFNRSLVGQEHLDRSARGEWQRVLVSLGLLAPGEERWRAQRVR